MGIKPHDFMSARLALCFWSHTCHPQFSLESHRPNAASKGQHEALAPEKLNHGASPGSLPRRSQRSQVTCRNFEQRSQRSPRKARVAKAPRAPNSPSPFPGARTPASRSCSSARCSSPSPCLSRCTALPAARSERTRQGGGAGSVAKHELAMTSLGLSSQMRHRLPHFRVFHKQVPRCSPGPCGPACLRLVT